MEDANWRLVLVALWGCFAAVATRADDAPPPVLVDPSSSYGLQRCITKCGSCPVICAPPPPSVPSMVPPSPNYPAIGQPPPPPPSSHHHTPSTSPPPPSQSTIYPYPYYFFYPSGSPSPVAVPVGMCSSLGVIVSLFLL